MRKQKLRLIFTYCCILFLFLCFISCNNQAASLSQNELTIVKDSVQQMMSRTSKDISANGPVAWLTYFEKSPQFFMASEGQLVFPNGDAAISFIKNILVKQVHKINLQWSNVRVDPLTTSFAGVAANWHEDITDFANNKTSQAGFFTAIAEKTPQGWQLRNAHWSATK